MSLHYRKFGLLVVFSLFIFMWSISRSFAVQPGEEKVSKEELTPTDIPLIAKYVPIAPAPKKVTVESLRDIFAEAKPLNVSLQKQDKAIPNGGGAIQSISAKAVHDSKFVYFLLEWADNAKDSSAMAPQLYRDAVALMFPVGKWTIDEDHPFSPRMGDREKPVNIWHWKADWQRDLASGGEHMIKLEEQYPNMWDAFSSDDYSLPVRDNLYNSAAMYSGGRSANNIFSLPNRGTTVEDLNAEGFYTLTTQEHQDVSGQGIWDNGRWYVLITRPLTTPDHFDVQFVPGDRTYFNMAVWDGSAGEVDGEKSISMRWHPVQLEQVPYKTVKPQ